MSEFAKLNLNPSLHAAIQQAGYQTPTPIQLQAIPHLLEGKDLLGIAQTGTGKTAAFVLPMLDKLAAEPGRTRPGEARALILTPTRELASQIAATIATLGRLTRLRHTVIFGGVGQNPQVRAMSRGVDILVATPGRLLDLMGQGHVRLSGVKTFVLDEADRMLDMGFINDVRRVVERLPALRQTLLFSATMSPKIIGLTQDLLTDPVHVEVTPQATTVDKVTQKVLFVDKNDKRSLLQHLLQEESIQRALVFTRTKHGADRVTEHLERNDITAAAIHGNKSQNARERSLEQFRQGDVRVLVATDIAARGIDVAGISHVINFDLPNEPESYVHRIGRTARAGLDGQAISFCDATEGPYLVDIERTIRQSVPVDKEHRFHCEIAARSGTGRGAAAASRGRPGMGGRGGASSVSRSDGGRYPRSDSASRGSSQSSGQESGRYAATATTASQQGNTVRYAAPVATGNTTRYAPASPAGHSQGRRRSASAPR